MPQRGLAASQRDSSQYDERLRASGADPARPARAARMDARPAAAPRASRMDARPAAPPRAATRDERLATAPGGVPGRRTVTIRGQGAERYVPRSRDRRPERRYERTGFRPDRAAMWAVLLCVMMIAAAAMSAHA
jgi:hypothetical protein